MKTVYLDKKERVLAWFTPARAVLVGVVAGLCCSFHCGRISWMAASRLSRCAELWSIPKFQEQWPKYSPMRDSPSPPAHRCFDSAIWNLESATAQAGAEMRNASARATQASLNYTNFGPAEHDRQQSTERHRSLTEEMKHLEVTSPINGL